MKQSSELVPGAYVSLPVDQRKDFALRDPRLSWGQAARRSPETLCHPHGRRFSDHPEQMPVYLRGRGHFSGGFSAVAAGVWDPRGTN